MPAASLYGSEILQRKRSISATKGSKVPRIPVIHVCYFFRPPILRVLGPLPSQVRSIQFTCAGRLFSLVWLLARARKSVHGL
jgi:hypothetical protein